ncbi:hypothetical protein C8A01DRAFT_40832 [Parachaetomium inaequale]|uniref:NACHT domain-containing protein n=1 Tax=Parachaetomium inaequale TaxID=2588326 RepID=A0AAN6PB26_9PEZI|nr:hypothetical protein C8A01DRAFT_40832 [Parachaetomium inaequale]
MSLWFPLMKDREEMIHDPHNQTFDWIFRDPAETGKPWDDIGKFLQTASSGTYWISGKAGSGKSTLMKYISNNATTRRLLLRWAGQNELVMVSFYFYHGGSELQKSEVGVLRSLLYQILATRPGLIQLAFPERFRALCIAGGQRETFEPSPTELRRAFNAVVQKCSDVNFFLAVDGLDEYNGADADMSLLVSMVRDLTQHSKVKGLLSSRPWAVFQQSFAGCPQLRLHDFTRPDIARFVSAKVGQHSRVQTMTAKDSQGVDNLMTEIVDASCGVFLWVYLVVLSVLEGLTNYDMVEEIRYPSTTLHKRQDFSCSWKRAPSRTSG